MVEVEVLGWSNCAVFSLKRNSIGLIFLLMLFNLAETAFAFCYNLVLSSMVVLTPIAVKKSSCAALYLDAVALKVVK